MLTLSKYSFGVGDRFAHQAKAQLKAFQLAEAAGMHITPVWNKSNREHMIVCSHPCSVLEAAQTAVGELDWKGTFHIDADHIRLSTVDPFLSSSDFYTIDVADSIGTQPASGAINAFVKAHPELAGSITIPGIIGALQIDDSTVAAVAGKYLAAAAEAGDIYRHIAAQKDPDSFITEVSMDETDLPQTPPELLIILAALADQKIPLQTIAPKFTGRFNKGVDYVGDIAQFETEFRDDLAVISYAISRYGLPASLKLSVHSGSDKFSIYGPIRQALMDTGAGLHIKTAGTTWLEEVIGLAESGGAGLELAKEIYTKAYAKYEELCAPYASVIDIDRAALPEPYIAASWTAHQYVAALRHDPACPEYNRSFRQLIHVGYKVAALMGERYLDLLVACEPVISRNVTGNIYDRHIVPLFSGLKAG